MSMSFSTRRFIFPTELVEREQWVLWTTKTRDGNETKVPIDPETEDFAKSDDPETWTDFETADKKAQMNEEYGLGFMFREDDPFVGIDLDKVRDANTGRVRDDDARFIVEKVNSYTELSPSGTGYHIIAKGELPEGRRRHNGIEMYDSGRFFTMSANHIEGSPQSAEERTPEIKLVHSAFVARQDDEEDDDSGGKFTFSGKAKSSAPGGSNLSDKQVVKKAKNSARGDKFSDLWNGNWEKYGYDSQSEADLAFACMLAFWTGGDEEQVHRLFKDSGLYRDKWERQHFSNGDTYGEATVKKAINNQTDFYGS